ncbi:MAG: tRNA pseudouridine(55) synthase TruB [Desulfobulbaceae bacterium]|nr:tRNA pseudouridine(55) synthase TruB [Desulfobulbaceae bacterium]
MDDRRPEEINQPDIAAGMFLIDKPRGETSFSMVRHVRRLLRQKKVGHAGTLDPFATGLLIICAGRQATRMIDRCMAGKKVYTAVLQLGSETETMDPEGRIVRTAPVPNLSSEQITSCLEEFTGRMMQVPPPYSAVKYKGKPLYYYARKGIAVVKEPRQVEIYSLAVVDYDGDGHRLTIDVACSKGTYIRVLADDIGRKLGCGAHLSELRRLSSGGFTVEDSLPGDALSGPDAREILMQRMIPVDKLLAMLGEEENLRQ